MKYLALVALTVSTLALGEEIVLVAPSGKSAIVEQTEVGERWKAREYVCAIGHDEVKVDGKKVEREYEKACGHVMMSTGRGAAIAWDWRDESVDKGDEVVLADADVRAAHQTPVGRDTDMGVDESDSNWEEMFALYFDLAPHRPKEIVVPRLAMEQIDEGRDKVRKKKRLLASEQAIEFTTDKPTPNYILGVGFFGLRPGLSFQVHMEAHFTVGITANLGSVSNDEASSTLFGGFFTVTRYFEEDTFHGYFLQAGAGAYSASTTWGDKKGSQSALSVVALGGRRWWWRAFNLGASAGLQFLRLGKTEFIDVSMTRLVPVISGDIAMKF